MAYSLRLVMANLALGLAYAGSGQLGLLVPFSGEAVTLVWPPSGIAFAALWCGGPALLPGIMLAAAGLNYLNFGDPLFALAVGVGNGLPALVAWALLRRLRGHRPLFDGVRGLVAFLILPVLLAPMLSASVGILAALAGGTGLGESVASGWTSWWLGDAMGVLLVAPPLILATAPGALSLIRRRWREALALVLAAGLLLWGLSLPQAVWLHEAGRLALFCLTLGAGLRLGLLGTSTYTLLVAAGLTAMTAQRAGPFASDSYHTSFATLLAALAVLAVAGLILATTMATLRRAILSEREARQQAEQALTRLRQTQDDLVQAEKMASLGRLVAGIAHEIATPVGTALSAATRLANDTRGIEQALAGATLRREQMNDYIDGTSLAARILQSNMERAARLIESFKHVAVDRTRQDRRRFDLAGYLEEIVISLRPQTRKTPHAIALTGASRLTVDTYPGAVAQLVTNLVVNAVTHAFPDGRAGRVELDLRGDEQGWVELRISDNGSGIAPDQMHRVFEPFFTTRRDRGGSGLGLYLAYSQVVQKLGGSMSVASTPGQGTCFTARFPAKAPLAATGDLPAPPPPTPIDLAAKRLSA
ncbi:MASE1 domain-containing protein [Niveispirillum fermenti]|uniref:MASE1 domain-containing protein n=1 Tax=Niveispirillum fermenti TaxID=1233113 RepID=UPI003A852B9B